MILTRLEVRHFRNLGAQELHFPPEGVAVIGDNAQGKTNLLEAIHYLESFRSFRGAKDRELPAFSHDAFFLRGTAEGDRPTTVTAGFDRRTRRKKVSVDGGEPPRVSSALGRLGTVAFSPWDVELIGGGPHRRRRFLDIVLALNRPGYVTSLSAYRQALAQRNAALKAGGGPLSVRAWDDALVSHGARVACRRGEWVAQWSGAFREYCAAVSKRDVVAMSYRSDLIARGDDADGGDRPPDERAAAKRFRERLDEHWARDLRSGATSTGPHRDELLFATTAGARALPLRRYGSGGQRRTAALALRLTEAATIRKHRGQEPVLLLDDAFAELDGRRSERIVELIEEERAGQVILTAPRTSGVHPLGSTLPRWRVREGVIEA